MSESPYCALWRQNESSLATLRSLGYFARHEQHLEPSPRDLILGAIARSMLRAACSHV